MARLGNLHWSADILALFPDFYFLLALLLVLYGLWKKTALALVFAALSLLLNGFLLLDYWPGKKVSAEPADVRLYVHNLYYQNDDVDRALAEIARHDPDINFLMEYSETIQAQIESAFAAYPYRLVEPSRFTMGLALFSRIPIEAAAVKRSSETRIPVFELRFRFEEQGFSFVGGHPWPPIGRWGQFHREQTAAITAVAAEAAHPLIVAGDFNASPWSFALRDLMRQAAVEDAKKGFGLRKSWQIHPLLKLPLDHVMVSNDIEVLNVQHGNRGGSDHDPLIIDLAFANP